MGLINPTSTKSKGEADYVICVHSIICAFPFYCFNGCFQPDTACTHTCNELKGELWERVS